MRRFICTTKYRGPTDTTGTCVLVYSGAEKRPVRVPWDYALDVDANHAAAALAAARKRDYTGAVASHHSYTLPDACEHGMVHAIQFKD